MGIERPASSIPGKLITDSQDVRAVLEHLGRTDLLGDVTAAIVEVVDGEYRSVWVTTSARYFEANTLYEQIL